MSQSRWKKTGRTLGEGGQAQVFVVRDSSGALDGEYALKRLKNATRAGRLDLEISATKSVHRTGARVLEIVDDYTVAEDEDQKPWYVSPLIPGGSLAGGIVAGAPYGGSTAEALRMFKAVVEAVLGLHARGVAHRDLKPDNILLAEDGPLLCDLGLCLPLGDTGDEARMTGELERIGSLHYIPKEAFGPKPKDRAQFAYDAYALGKILYVLLAGHVLPGFTNPNFPQYDLALQRPEPVYTGINAVLRGLLHDDPERRLRTLEDLSEEIDDLIAWAEQMPLQDEDLENLRVMLTGAGEIVARHALVQEPVETDPGDKVLCEEVRNLVAEAWNESEHLRLVEHTLVSPHTPALSMPRHPSGNQLRDVLTGPYVKTHYGFEPLEELGYPIRPEVEVGCALALTANGELSKRLPALWLGCCVGMKGGKLHVSIATVRKEGGINGYADIEIGSQSVTRGTPHEGAFVRVVQERAAAAAKRFAERSGESVQSYLDEGD